MQSQWLQEVANGINLAPLSEKASVKLLEEIEAQMKAVIQLSFKLQKHAKKTTMTVEDVNLAMTSSNVDGVYGLLGVGRGGQQDLTPDVGNIPNTTVPASIAMKQRKVDLATYACQPLPQCPLVPEAHFHWLAVGGVQPVVPQNPEVVVYDCATDTSGLPREIAYFYTKITQLVLSATDADTVGENILEACGLLRRDSGLQVLVGYLCRFVFVNIRRNLKRTHILYSLLQVIHSLVLNPLLKLESCLHQLLPSVLSCIVGAKVGEPIEKENSNYSSLYVQFPVSQCSVWSEMQPIHVRNFGAIVVQSILARYGETFPDLLPRVCKTYLQAAFTTKNMPSKSLSRKSEAEATKYGGIVGLGMLGERVFTDVLLPNICMIISHSNTDSSIEEKTCIEVAQSGGLISRKNTSTHVDRKYESYHNACYSSRAEMLLVSIVQWYIRKSMNFKAPLNKLIELQANIVAVQSDCGDINRHKRRKLEPTDMHDDWEDFIDNHIEHFVRPYVATASTELRYCSDLFI